MHLKLIKFWRSLVLARNLTGKKWIVFLQGRLRNFQLYELLIIQYLHINLTSTCIFSCNVACALISHGKYCLIVLFYLISEQTFGLGLDGDMSYLWKSLVIMCGIYLFFFLEYVMKMIVRFKQDSSSDHHQVTIIIIVMGLSNNNNNMQVPAVGARCRNGLIHALSVWNQWEDGK